MKPLSGALALATRLAKHWPPEVGHSPSDVVHRENKWRLLRYRQPDREWRTPVLLIPSLINRYYVLDLAPGRSFVEYLIAAGHQVYCIDWGTPGDEDRWVTFDDICDRAIGRALRRVATDSPDHTAHVLGYCLGGTLAAIHAAARPSHVATLTALAAPIDFDHAGTLTRWVRTRSFDLEALVSCGNVPWRLMHGAFHLLRPTLTATKWVNAIERADSAEFLDGFFATERWSTDNVSFPGAAYRRYIEALYRQNQLVRGEFRLGERRARLEAIRCPVNVVCFEGDTIVPEASATPLAERVGSEDVELWCQRGSHVGSVVSRSASRGVWRAMRAFWEARDCRQTRQPMATRVAS